MTEPTNPTGRIAGIDFGTVRVGVAVTNSQRTIASPVESYTRQSLETDARYFKKLAADEQIVQWVVGLPVHLAGHESAKSVEARAFGRWLAETTGVPVVFFDERFTTAEADEMLLAAGLTGDKRKKRRDMLAAQIMLAAFLEAGQPAASEPQGLDDPTPRPTHTPSSLRQDRES
ncbi:MAG: Holliday junction resolvase RuvX [Planctomycetia bacterium]|nr:Holliday junction resolvase RuvX [Planctomycetia bacterium]